MNRFESNFYDTFLYIQHSYMYLAVYVKKAHTRKARTRKAQYNIVI